MDVNDLRSAVTVIGLLLFALLVVQTWRRSRRAEFEAAAMLPFQEEVVDAAVAADGEGAR